MALWRLFRLSNRYISLHALLLLRFYLAQFYYLGLMRVRYEAAHSSVHLTPYSVTIARMLGLFFAYFLSLALLHPYVLLLHIQLFVFACCLLVQPRRVYEERIRLINCFLRLAPELYRRCRCKLRLSWMLVLQLVFRLLTFKMYFETFMLSKDATWKLFFMAVFVVPVSMAIWVMDMTSHLMSIALTILTKSFELMNDELASIAEKLPVGTLKGDQRAVQRLQRRLRSLQRLHRTYAKLTQELLDCITPQLVLIIVYNLSMIYSALLCPILATHGWLERRRYRWRLQDGDSCSQSVRRCLLQPGLQVLGLVTPNRQLFFRLAFAYCSFLHLHYMWKKSAVVSEQDITIDNFKDQNVLWTLWTVLRRLLQPLL
ncbi:GL17498 [Drosophila persimilis]|uniref:GL17498 n=1 Tax=Drosophila persimilis TaxID=7234 RepID=B4GHC0_DROPE|nr:GL17498 [Drosophila persimilis]